MNHPKTCGQLIKQVNTALEKNANNALRGDDLTMAQVSMLLALYDMPDRTLSLKELEEVLHLAQSTVAGIASRLEQKGYLEYSVAPKDKRVKWVHMTAAGEICCLRARRRLTEAERMIFAGLTLEEQADFLILLDKLINQLP